MRGQFRAWAAIALVGGLLAAPQLVAQERGAATVKDQGMMRDMMAMMGNCPMMGAMMQGPGAALAQRKVLGLTDAQAQRIEALRASEAQAMKQPMDRMTALHQRMEALAAAEQFDEGAVRAEFDRMGALHTEMGVVMVRTMHEVRSVLTPEQRQKLAAGSGGGMGMMGMMGCPMMGGMMGDMKPKPTPKP